MKTENWLKMIFAAAVAFGSCQIVSASESEDTAKKSVKEAAKGDYAKFQKRLIAGRGTKASRDIYEVIRYRASGYKKISASEVLINSGYGFRVYNVDVYGENPRDKSLPKTDYIVSATVQCAVSRQYSSGYCYGRGPGWGGGWGWGYGSCTPGYLFENEKCAVTTLHEGE